MSSAGPMGPSGRSTSDPADLARRGVSVSLRATADSTDPSDAMDPANQSLHEALRITYRLVQLAMVVLGGLFLVSGFQGVNEGEQGIRLLFGKRDPELLQPGFRFSAPFPLGELIRVRTGVEQVDLSTEFWPFLSSEDKAKPITQLYGRESLKPENDGSAITADGGLVHMQWRVRYGRTNPGLFSENLRPEIEERLVRSAVQRGVVQAASQVRVDDLLKQSNDDVGSLASRAREVAQATLDRAGSGITIERLSLLEKMPPLFLKDKFAMVQTAQQRAQQLQEKAVSDAQRRMSETAGGAAATLVALIDEYEASIERGDEPMRESLLARIDVILEGRAEESSLRVAGEVTRVLSEANRYRSAIANERRSDLSSFMAKMEQFASNPLVTVHREWSDALRAFSERETVETMLIPRGTTTLTMVINRDPEIARRIETKIREAEAETSRTERERRQRDARFRTDEGLKSTPGT
ncbi:MAG: hypothetical protein KF787_02640 [Phycisphaeraceae bacterium]|nr:hypothetical protein [Phycisphaerae bacterium]MBX3391524.1 hypothetical protein [Phycisphaeraceae bacterium]